MGREYIKSLRYVDKVHNRSNDEERVREKIQKCYNPVKTLVDREISKGVDVFVAIDKVLNNFALAKVHPELDDSEVKTKVRSFLINFYINRNKDKKMQKDER